MPTHAERRNMPEGPHLCMQMTNFTSLTSCSCGWVTCMLEKLSAKISLTTCGIVVVLLVTLSSAMSASAASFHVGLRSPNQNELHCTDRFCPRWAKTTRATRDDPMTASLPWLTSCSCVIVVCVVELLSATSSWAKATKTERQERHDESLHARNRICHVCAAQRGWNAVEPCLSTTSKTSTWPFVCVCVEWSSFACKWPNLNMPKANMPTHAERRNMPEGPQLCMQMTKLKATQKWRGVTGVTAAPKPVQARHPVPSVPRLPRKTTVDVQLRLPREIKVDVTKWHACHAEAAASRASRRRLNQSKRATQCHLSHAGHTKRR